MRRNRTLRLHHIVVVCRRDVVFFNEFAGYFIDILAMINLCQLIIMFQSLEAERVHYDLAFILRLPTHVLYQAAHKKQIIQLLVFPSVHPVTSLP